MKPKVHKRVAPSGAMRVHFPACGWRAGATKPIAMSDRWVEVTCKLCLRKKEFRI